MMDCRTQWDMQLKSNRISRAILNTMPQRKSKGVKFPWLIYFWQITMPWELYTLLIFTRHGIRLWFAPPVPNVLSTTARINSRWPRRQISAKIHFCCFIRYNFGINCTIQFVIFLYNFMSSVYKLIKNLKKLIQINII